MCFTAKSHCCTGGNIASSWAVLQCMGQDGYTEVAKRLMEIATHMKEGIQSIEVRVDRPLHIISVCDLHVQGLYVCGTPHMTIFSFASSDKKLGVFALADLMETKGILHLLVIIIVYHV